MEHNWSAAKDYYINAGYRSGVSLQDVAERYNIPYQSVRRRAAKEQWRLVREWKCIDDGCATVEEYIYYYKKSADNPVNF